MDDDRHRTAFLLTSRLTLALVVLVAATACQHASGASVGAVACPSGDPLRGVYNPKRLTVLGTCRWFKGTVTQMDERSDGDLHLLLAPEPAFTAFLNTVNVNAGGMIVEIVPGQQLPPPAIGERIAVYGTWVLDEHNGWNEIHPVWAIRYLDTGQTVQALPPVPPEYTGGAND